MVAVAKQPQGRWWTLPEICSLNDKQLVSYFSEPSSNELTRNFAYTCYLLPNECAAIFTSFGNESRARDEIKYHLFGHLRTLIAQAKDNPSIVFRARTVNGRQPPGRRHTKSAEISKKKVLPVLRGTRGPYKKQRLVSGDNSVKLNSESGAPKPKKNYYMLAKQRRAAEMAANIAAGGTSWPSSNLEAVKTKKKEASYLSVMSEISAAKKCLNVFHKSGDVAQFHRSMKVHPSFANVRGKLGDDEKRIMMEPVESWSNLSTAGSVSTAATSTVAAKNCVNIRNVQNVAESGRNGPTTAAEQSEEYVEVDDELESILLQQPYCDHPYAAYHPLNRFSSHGGLSEDEECEVEVDMETEYAVEELLLQLLSEPVPKPDCLVIPMIRISRAGYLGGSSDTRPTNGMDWLATMGSKELTQQLDADGDQNNDLFADSSLSSSDDENIVASVDSVQPLTSSTNRIFRQHHKTVDNTSTTERELAMKYIREIRSRRDGDVAEARCRSSAYSGIGRFSRYGGSAGDEDLSCKICNGKQFTAIATLLYHYRSHAGIKPFTCQICRTTFTRQHSLNYHMLIHNNQNRFACSECGRMFRHPSHYKEHLRRHTGETPFSCIDCPMRFKTRNTYKRHLRTHHGKLLAASGIRTLTPEEWLDVRPTVRRYGASLQQQGESSIERTEKLQVPKPLLTSELLNGKMNAKPDGDVSVPSASNLTSNLGDALTEWIGDEVTALEIDEVIADDNWISVPGREGTLVGGRGVSNLRHTQLTSLDQSAMHNLRVVIKDGHVLSGVTESLG